MHFQGVAIDEAKLAEELEKSDFDEEDEEDRIIEEQRRRRELLMSYLPTVINENQDDDKKDKPKAKKERVEKEKPVEDKKVVQGSGDGWRTLKSRDGMEGNLDMFAEDDSQVFASKTEATAASTDHHDPHLTDNWDDAEGYYRFAS